MPGFTTTVRSRVRSVWLGGSHDGAPPREDKHETGSAIGRGIARGMPTDGQNRPAVTVAIIDDHDVVHAGVDAWCADADPPIRLVGSFATPSEFFARGPDGSNEVDVVLLDLQIDGNRPEFRTLRELCESGQCVVVYSHLT